MGERGGDHANISQWERKQLSEKPLANSKHTLEHINSNQVGFFSMAMMEFKRKFGSYLDCMSFKILYIIVQ